MHADGGDEDVDERGAEFGCAGVVEFARRSEGEDEPGKRYQQHLPEEGAVQAVFGGERVLAKPGGKRIAKRVAGADGGEGEAEHLH